MAVDLETTGFDGHRHEILEIGAVAFSPESTSWFQTFVRPQGPVPKTIQRLTGITEKMVAAAPTAFEALEGFRQFVGGRMLVAHNAPFDRSFLAAQGFTPPGLFVDSLYFARLLKPLAGRHGLRALAEEAGLSFRHHRALEDARATALLFEAWLGVLVALPEELKEQLRPLAAAGSEDNLKLLAEHLGPPTLTHPFSPGAPPVQPAPPAKTSLPSFPAFLAHAGLEERRGQVAMAEAVAGARAGGELLVVEAGCGVGKSLGYLWPSLADGGRTVVSTHTHTLQEQLVEKDLPQVGRSFDPAPEIALLKGRSNYLCLLRLSEEHARVSAAGTDEERQELTTLYSWLYHDTSKEGGRGPTSRTLWERINVLEDGCHREKCPFYRPCFFFAARRKAELAQVVVVNHALLVTDAALGGGVLPPYEHLVIDEAHHLEAVATDHMGLTLEDRRLAGALTRLSRIFSRRAPTVARRAHEGLYAFESFAALCQSHLRQRQTVMLSGPDPEAVPDAVSLAYGQTLMGLKALSAALLELEGTLEPEGGLALEVESGRSLVHGALETLQEVFEGSSEVCWLERRGKALVFRASPLFVGELLRDGLFSRIGSGVLTSATLSVEGRFTHLLRKLGLSEEERVRTLQVPSPFSLADQALLANTVDFPDPRDAAFGPRGAALLRRLLPQVGGRTLVLFTSYEQLRLFYDSLKEPLAGKGLTLLAQGRDGRRSQLLDALRKEAGTVVFGTQSFWEGIDVVGPALSLVVVVKLPFQPPDHPVYQARAAHLEAHGESPFMALALPEAVLRFKQGFGRLIRSSYDVGAVLVLDPRLAQKGYGRAFLRSLDGPKTCFGTEDEVASAIRGWLS